MKNGSSRGPANTCMPLREPSTVLSAPVTAGVDVGDLVLHRARDRRRDRPAHLTCWLAPSPVKVTWMTLSSMRVAVGVDLELVEQVGVERRLGRIGAPAPA